MVRKLLLLALVTSLLIPCGVVLAQDEEPPAIQPVTVDIKPGTCINPVNVKSRGVIPVAILLDSAIALEDIVSIEVAYQPPETEEGVIPDPILLLQDGLPLEPVKIRLRDVSSPAADCEEEVLDGIDDIVLKYRTRALVRALATDAEVVVERRQRQEITLLFTVTLADATVLQGDDTIRAKNPGRSRGHDKR